MIVYNTKVIDTIKEWFLSNKKTIAVAESVTAGHLQAALSMATDASRFFQGGITTYNLGQKCRHLHIEPTHALECNSVSALVADDMAKNVCGLFLSDYGIGVTGYASLVPEQNINSLFAYVSIAHKDKVILAKQISVDEPDSYHAQVHYTNIILDELAAVLQLITK
jgi:nicotinamide-nucleotide amidase